MSFMFHLFFSVKSVSHPSPVYITAALHQPIQLKIRALEKVKHWFYKKAPKKRSKAKVPGTESYLFILVANKDQL